MLPLRPTPYSKNYEITDAMFGAFRTPGGMPFFWKLFAAGTLMFTVMGLFAIKPMLSAYTDLISVSAVIEEDPDQVGQMLSVLGQFFLVFALFMIGYSFVVAVLRAAFFRAYFFNDLGGTIPIKLGWDEVRQFFAYLGYYGIIMLFIILLMVLAIVPSLLIAFATGGESIFAVVISVIFIYGLLIAGYIWLGVRLSAASALTALNGKTHVFAARNVSKNRFWPLFGSILVAGLIGYVSSNIASTIGMQLAFPDMSISEYVTLVSGSDPAATVETFERLADGASFNILSILAIVLLSGGYSFYILMLSGPQAFFTRQWAEANGPVDDGFDA